MTARLDFHGCYTAIVTPFTADGSAVDLARLEEGVRRQAAGGVTGIVPCGTTGESPTLSEEEHARVVETAVRVGRAARLQVVAGAGSNSTAHAVHLQKLAFQLGADAVQMGTAFLACDESGAHPAWKAVLAEADTRGTRLTRVFSGRHARGLVNGFMDAMRPHEDAVPVYPVQNALTGELRAAATRAGDVEAMSLWAGQAAALARRLPIGALGARLAAEYDAAVAGLGGVRG